MTWNEFKSAIDKAVAALNHNGDVEVNLIYIMDCTDASKLNVRVEDMMLEIDE